MNNRPLLALSLLLNFLLLSVVVRLSATRPKPEAHIAEDRQTAARPAAIRSVKTTNMVATALTNVMKIDWRMVESENYKQYIVNLRSIGCPEETIRDIIVADVNKLFESRRKELFPSTNKFEYWKGGNFFASLFDEKKMEKQKELNAEKRALLKELLGVDVPDSPDIVSGTKTFEAMLDFLPADKQTQLIELEQKFAGRLAKNMKDLQRGDVDALKKFQAEKDAEMLKILSPDEKFEYDLRMSQSAMIMRMQMGDVEVSEQEFRDLFKARKQFDDQFGALGITSNKPEEADRRSAAQKELDAQTRKALGDDRYVEYKYSANFERSSLNKIAEQFQVPRQAALKVFDIRAVAQEEAANVRKDTLLSSDQRQAKLNDIRRVTEQEVGKLIGNPALQAYIDKGTWLKGLNTLTAGNRAD